MSAIFATPVAALHLAVELLLFELRPRSLLPVARACAVAGGLRNLVFGPGPLFPLHTDPVSTIAFASCVAAGLMCGVLAALLTLALYRVEDGFHKLPLHWMWWPAIGGVLVGIGGYLEPRALGMGYDVIGALLNGHLLVAGAIALLTVKAIIWGVTLGAPITSIGDAFALTHDSVALLPLMLTTAVAYGLTTLTLKRSIMTEKIARRGLHIIREYGVDPLERQHVSDLMNSDVIAIDGAM